MFRRKMLRAPLFWNPLTADVKWTGECFMEHACRRCREFYSSPVNLVVLGLSAAFGCRSRDVANKFVPAVDGGAGGVCAPPA